MKKVEKSASSTLRAKAEELLSQKMDPISFDTREADNLKLIHELEVHQIELELQNQELEESRQSAFLSACRYSDLYDFSPAGHFTLTDEGVIVQLNLTGSVMLGRERSALVNKSFLVFVADSTKLDFLKFLDRISITRTRETCSIILEKNNSTPMHVLLSGIIDEEGKTIRVSAIDVTESKRLENVFKTRNTILEFSYDSSLDQLLQFTLDEAERLSGSAIAFFHFVEDDQVTVSLQTWSTNTLQTMCTTNAKGLHYPIDQAGVWTDCIATHAPVVHNDYRSLPHRKGLPVGHATIRRELVVPILRKEKIVALLGVGNKETDYDDTDVQSISQIADLVWDLAERKMAEEEKQQTNEALSFLAQYTDIEKKLDFFSELARYLADALDANYVCIDRLEGDGLNARTLAVLHDDVFEDNVVYSLKDTPCGDVVGKAVCCFPAGVTRLFPRDTVLQDLKAESYIGVTLWSHSGTPIGLIAVIRNKPLVNRKRAEELLKLVGVRASGELERLDVELEGRKAQEEIQAWNARFKKLSANTPGLIYQFTRRPDGSYCVPISSEGIRDIFGCGPEDVIEDFGPVGNVIHPEDIPLVFEAIDKSARELTEFTCEFRTQLPGKEIRWNYTRSTPEKMDDGSINWYGFCTDITERRLAEEENRAGQALLKMMTTNFPDGMITLWDENLRYVFAEGLGLADIGLSSEALVGRQPRDLFPDDFSEILESKIAEAFKGEKISFEMARGANVFYDTLLPLKNDRDEIFAVMGVTINITKRKNAEQRIIELNETLEKRIAERTLQLEAANREMRFHLDEIEQFAYITSHDLQEPLNTIINYSGLIHGSYAGKLDANGNKSIEFIHRSAFQMKTLVTELLMYSLLGKESIRSTLDCNEIVREVISDLAIPAGRQGPLITVRKLPVVQGYAAELRLLFKNLVENAVKFGKKDIQPEIEISASDLGTDWTFYVEDNGIGIHEEDHTRIFTIFKRMVKRDDFSGTGIGLAYCKKIVEMHGGRIWVKSFPEKGSVFIFTIPKQKEA